MKKPDPFRLLFMTFVCICIASFLRYPAFAADAAVYVPVTYDQQSARDSLSLINSFRAEQGKAPLQYDYELEQAAMQRAAEIAVSFSHTSPSGGTIFSILRDTPAKDLAENLAEGYNTAELAVYALREEGLSPSMQGHRRIMLGEYQAVGISHAVAGQRHYWVQIFRTYCGNAPAVPAQMGRSNVTVALWELAQMKLVSDTTKLSLTAKQVIPLPEVKVKCDYSRKTGALQSFVPVSLRWESEAPWVAKVEGGSLVGIGGGQTTLTASLGSLKLQIPVTVSGDAVKPNLSAPSISKAVLTDGGVKLSWKQVPGAVKYRVFCKTGRAGWKKVADTAAASYLCDKKGFSEGKRYTFTVRCVSADGKRFTGGYNKTGVTLTYRERYATPELRTVQVIGGGIRISWKAVPGSPQYRVFYRVNGKGSWKKLADTEKLAYTWKKAKPGVKYAFTVRCVSADGKHFTSGYSKTGKSCCYLPVAQITGAAVRSGSVLVSVKYPKSAVTLEHTLLLCDCYGEVYSRLVLKNGKSSVRLKLPGKGFWYIHVQTEGFVRTGAGSSRWTRLENPEYRVVYWA